MKTSLCPTCRRPMRRSSQANRRYWELVRLLSQKLTYAPEVVHEYLKRQYLPLREVELPDWTTVLLSSSTADLSTDEFSTYMTQVEAFCADQGIYLCD